MVDIVSKIKKEFPNLSVSQRKLVAMKLLSLDKLPNKKGRGKIASDIQDLTKGMSGKGIKSFLKKIGSKVIEKGLDITQKISNVTCKKENRNPDWEYKPKAGEKHQVLNTNGCAYRARYSGPGTHALQNTKELLKKHNGNISLAIATKNFASKVDKEAMAHDTRYGLAAKQPDKEKLVRKADEKFIKVLQRIPDKRNVIVPLNGMKAKVAAENFGLVGQYSGDSNLSPEDRKLLERVIAHLEMQGFGSREYFERQGFRKERPKRSPKEECKNCGRVLNRTGMRNHMNTMTCRNFKKKK